MIRPAAAAHAEEIVARLAKETFAVDVVDGDGKVVAQVEKVVHVRRKDG